MRKSRSKAAYMISAVAEQYDIHPQTLRLYEREGLLRPSRSDGNTRLYTDDDLERLEIILNMRAKMEAMQQQMQEFVATMNQEIAARVRVVQEEPQNSLIPVVRVPSEQEPGKRRKK